MELFRHGRMIYLKGQLQYNVDLMKKKPLILSIQLKRLATEWIIKAR